MKAHVRPTAININNIIFVEANLANISAKFQFYSPNGKFSLSDAMTTNEIQRFGQK